MTILKRSLRHLILPLALLPVTGFAQINLGTIGDSLTDEYLRSPNQFSTDLAAMSWVEVLAATRPDAINFGSYRADDGAPWGDARDYGYAYNWAKVGAAASTSSRLDTPLGKLSLTGLGGSYASEQASGLATQITNGEVGFAYVGIGSNDFFYRTSQFDFSGNSSPSDEFINDPSGVLSIAVTEVRSGIIGAVETLQAAGSVNILLGLLPAGTAAEGEESADILGAIDQLNAELIAYADGTEGVVVIDSWAFNQDPSRFDTEGNLLVGDLVIDVSGEAGDSDLAAAANGPCNSAGLCATESHALNFIAEDGIHPNTAVQGLIANEILKGLNEHYGTDIALLSDSEIQALTGVAEVPLPAAAWLFGSALMLLAGRSKTLSRQR